MTETQTKKIKLAFFDIDGTIFRSSLLIELINGLVESGVFPRAAWPEMEKARFAWLDRVGRYDDYLWKVVEVHLKYIKGCSWSEVSGVVDRVMRNHKNHVYRYTRDLIIKLKKQGYMLVAISGSPIYMVERFAKYMGFDSYFGQMLEIRDGVFTGKISNPDFLEKEKVLKRFLADTKLNVDWKNSVAVGDTDNDIPMLKMVGRPIAFNPNAKFAKYAKKNGWEIVVERKDAIFKLKDFEVISGDKGI